jgi:hypothetical protein
MILDQLIQHKQVYILHRARLSTIRSLRRTIVELRRTLQNRLNNIGYTFRIRAHPVEFVGTLQNWGRIRAHPVEYLLTLKS